MSSKDVIIEPTFIGRMNSPPTLSMLLHPPLVAFERINVLTSILRSGSNPRNGSNRFMQTRWAMALALGALLASTAAAKDIVVQPEQATVQRTTARNFMVASAHPLATQAGYDVLTAGGSAADAAVAVQVMLALVEPQNSGLVLQPGFMDFDSALPVAVFGALLVAAAPA